MRAIYTYVAALCFLLLGSIGYAHAAAHHHKTVTVTTAKPHYIKFASPSHEHALIKKTVSADDGEYALDVDDNDEDDHFSARKYVLLVKCFVALSFAFLFSYLYNSIKDRLPHCGHLAYSSSYKYITQRVLRI